MLLVFSGHANNSIEVKKEIALASRYNVIVVPVRVEDVVPNDALTYELAVRQWIDLFDDWEHAIERLVVHLSTMVHPEAPAASRAPASEARPTVTPVAAAPRPARRSRLLPLLAVLFAVLFLGTGGLAWHFWRELPHPGVAGGPPVPSPLPPAPSPAPQPPPAPSPTGQPSPRAAAPPPSTPATAATASVAAQAGGANPATFRDCPNCPEMVVIPAGRFEMGSTAAEQQRFEVPADTAARELPRHDVVIAKPFALAKFDVTRAEFAAFISAGEFRPITGCQTVVEGRWMPGLRLGWDNPGFDQSPRDRLSASTATRSTPISPGCAR